MMHANRYRSWLGRCLMVGSLLLCGSDGIHVECVLRMKGGRPL